MSDSTYKRYIGAFTVFGRGTVPDGYNGARAAVDFAFDPATGKTIEIHAHGCHNSGLPAAGDIEEAKWLLRHHPIGRRARLA